ncbi:MAG: hypothetical protein ACI9N1_002357 [Flavobacteriales bacterium]|jgi:hypothetical protein
MKWLLLLILTSLLCQYSIGQEFPIDCEISKSLAKDDFIKGERYWGTYDSIESNNRLIIQAFENYIKIKYSIILEPHPAPIRFTDDASFINIIDNEEEGQIFLQDDCYYLELKRLILEKVGSDFIEVGKQYILNRIDSIIEANPDFYFKIESVSNFNALQTSKNTFPTIPDYAMDSVNFKCPEVNSSKHFRNKEYVEIKINRNGKLVSISPLLKTAECWSKEVIQILEQFDGQLSIAYIDGYAVNYEYIIPVNIKFE